MADRAQLSAAQMALLRKLASGLTLLFLGAGSARYAWSGAAHNARRPNPDTVHVLRTKGLVEDYAADWKGHRTRISAAGRALLAESDRG